MIYEGTTSQQGVVDVICPILVTNAELRMLNRDLNIENLDKASCLEDISESIDFVCLTIPKSNELNKYIEALHEEKIKETLKLRNHDNYNDYEIENFQKQLNKLKFDMNVNGIIVCNLKYFEELTGMVENLATTISFRKKQ